MGVGRRSARRILNSRKYAECVSVVQQLPGARDEHGEFVAGAVRRTSLNCSIQSVGLQTMSLLRESGIGGEGIVDARMFFIPTDQTNFTRPLRIGENQTDNDKIEYSGLLWHVVRIEDYSNHGHIEVTAVRKSGQSDALATTQC